MTPTIVNPKSTFVVVTYWWGRGNLNKNTARPCLEFYEKILMRPFNILSSYTEDLSRIPETYNFLSFLQKTKLFKQFYKQQAIKYTEEAKRGTRSELSSEHALPPGERG